MDKKLINGYFIDDTKLTTSSCWMDLLGFGAQLDKLNWHLNNSNIKPLYDRLSRISQQFLKSFPNYEKISMINDGILRTLRNDYYYTNGLITWLENCFRTHCICTGQEKDLNLPGMRTIICEGQFFSHEFQLIHYKSECYELNTAFAKCYIADNAGSHSGLKRGSIYVEKIILDILVTKLGCKSDGSYIILTQDSRVKEIGDISIYELFYDCISLEKHSLLENAIDRDRSSWIKLGETVTIERNNLTLELIEIVLYSPFDETAFCYFDTFRGNMHGIMIGIPHVMFPSDGFSSDIEFRYADNKDIVLINETIMKIDKNK